MPNDKNNSEYIINEFKVFTKTTETPTLSGFFIFLLEKLEAHLVREISEFIDKDDDTHFFINKYLEHYLISGMLSGDIRSDPGKFILKNIHGYTDVPIAEVLKDAEMTHNVTLTLAEPPNPKTPKRRPSTDKHPAKEP